MSLGLRSQAALCGIRFRCQTWPPTPGTRFSAAGATVLEARQRYPGRTLAQLYDPQRMPADLLAAHAGLDALVDQAFGTDGPCPDEEARQEILFRRYEELANAESLLAPARHTSKRGPRRK